MTNKNPKGETRYKCRRCGNSAMFVYSGQAKVEKLMIWMGREQGYKSDDSLPTKTSVLSLKPVPTACWVCGSSDITRAIRTQEELNEIASSG